MSRQIKQLRKWHRVASLGQMHSWQARWAFALLIIAAVLAYHAYRVIERQTNAESQVQLAAEGLGALLALVLGLNGLRLRYGKN